MGPRSQGLILMFRFLGRGRSRPASILLAVAWGTLSMMLLLAFGEGLKRQMEVGRYGLGRDPVILWAGTTTKAVAGNEAGAAGSRSPMRTSPASSARSRRSTRSPASTTAGPSRSSWGAKTVSAHLTGVMPCYETIRTHCPQRGGRFINDDDIAQGRRVLFLGPKLKDRLFGAAEAVGQTVFVRGVPFTVIGVMIDKQQNGMYGGPDVDKASIPLSAFESIFGKGPYDNILYTVKAGHESKDVEKEVREVFARRQRFDPAGRGGDPRLGHDQEPQAIGQDLQGNAGLPRDRGRDDAPRRRRRTGQHALRHGAPPDQRDRDADGDRRAARGRDRPRSSASR